MKRRAFQLIVLLLLGAIVNVVVACACVMMPRSQLGWPSLTSHSEFEVSRLDFLSDVTFSYVSWRRGFVIISQQLKNWSGTVLPSSAWIVRPSWSIIEPSIGHPLLTELVPADPRVERFVEAAAGWPCLATYGCLTANNDWANSTVVSTRGLIHFPELKRLRLAKHMVPVNPIWPGFAINTIFYAAVLWVMFVIAGAPFALRRRLRIRRGLCHACAYPIGSSPVCTECGANLPLPRDGEGMSEGA